ncbi:phosphatidate cytidylyltransferase [Rhodobacteraceae bacterium]|nr:phosphatidate cytidylyltransferase [Paracoccaceae bacterium]
MTTQAGKWGDLGPRVLSGGFAAVFGLWIMWLGGIPFHALVAVVTGIMVWEVARMVGAGSKAVPYGLLAGAGHIVLTSFPIAYTLPLVFLPGLLGVAQLDRRKTTYALFCTSILLGGLGLVILRDNFGFLWVAWLALVVMASDILGYFAGKIIGGPKFWPKVSPKKTWSGTIAGWIGAAMVAVVYIQMGYATAELIGISISIAIAGQLGDVAESALKRRVGVKDSSAIFPGHGGMFDRFDAMLGAALFLLLIIQIVSFPPVPV